MVAKGLPAGKRKEPPQADHSGHMAGNSVLDLRSNHKIQRYIQLSSGLVHMDEISNTRQPPARIGRPEGAIA